MFSLFDSTRSVNGSLPTEMIRPLIEDLSFLARLLSSFLLSGSSMIYGQAFWSLMQYAASHWIWTSTRDYLAPPGYLQTYASLLVCFQVPIIIDISTTAERLQNGSSFRV